MGASRIFKIDTPYGEDELFDIGFEQTADIIYLAHPDHDPHKLTRYRHDQWAAEDVTFASKTTPPTGVTATKGGGTPSGYTAITHTYTVTAVDAVSGEESLIGNTDDCLNDLTLVDLYNTITWVGVTGADLYNVYKDVNGIWGYIGSATTLTFRDDGIAPDLSDTAPTTRDPFTEEFDKPACITFFQQRSMWGRTKNRPGVIYGSQSANFENMNTSRPARDDDALTFNLVGRQVNAVRHLVPMKSLIALCDTSIQALRGVNGALTPTSVDITPEGYRGSGKARPQLIDEVTFYSTAKGSAIRTLGFSFEADGWRGNDITVFAPHLFKGHQIIEMAWCEFPTATLWALRDDGKLCALTWLQEQDIWGWSLCETDGVVESICAVTEGLEDILYAVIRRTIDEAEKRYIERLATPYGRAEDDGSSSVNTAVYLDCSRTYDGDPADVISGLSYLEGRTVTALADGAVITGLVVADGAVTLPEEASVVTVGLPYEAWAQTLKPIIATREGSSVGATISNSDVYLDLVDTRGIEIACGRKITAEQEVTSANAGIEFTELDPRTSEDMGTPPYLMNGSYQAVAGSDSWSDGTVVVRQLNPLPMHVTGIFPDAKFGGS